MWYSWSRRPREETREQGGDPRRRAQRTGGLGSSSVSERQRPRGRAIVAAIGVTVVVALIRAAASPWVAGRVALLPFLSSVLVAAWLGGFWPGILATVLGGLTGVYFFIEPTRHLVPADPGQWFGILLFLGFGAAFSAAFESLIWAHGRSE